MFNFSALKGCPILSKKNLCIIGNLKDCVFQENLKVIAYFLCINNEGDFFISPDRLTALNDALVLEDCTSVLSVEDVDFTLLKTLYGKDVYTDKGHKVGSVTDLSFDITGKVGQISLEESTLSTSAISGVGDIILLKAPAKRRKKPKEVNLLSFATEDRAVTILAGNNLDNGDLALSPTADNQAVVSTSSQNIVTADIPAPATPISSTPTLTAIAQSTPVPTRIISDYNFLLGRTLTSALYAFTGSMIAPAGTIVTVDIVDKARLNGKLLELTYNSK